MAVKLRREGFVFRWEKKKRKKRKEEGRRSKKNLESTQQWLFVRLTRHPLENDTSRALHPRLFILPPNGWRRPPPPRLSGWAVASDMHISSSFSLRLVVSPRSSFFFFFFSHHCAFRPTLSTTVPPFLQRCSPFFWPREKPLDHPYPSLSLVAGERLILISSLKSSALFEHSLVSLLSRTFFAFFPFLFFSFFFGEYLYFG